MKKRTDEQKEKKTANKKKKKTEKQKEKNRQTVEKDHRWIIFASLYPIIKKWVISFYWGKINAISPE